MKALKSSKIFVALSQQSTVQKVGQAKKRFPA
jgi:hypothetical protein